MRSCARGASLENAPNDKEGRPSKNGSETSVSTPMFDRWSSKSSSVLSVRLAQDKPKFYDVYLLGKHKSVTAAATAAGLLKDDANLRRGKSAYRKMTAEQRKEFKSWLKKN